MSSLSELYTANGAPPSSENELKESGYGYLRNHIYIPRGEPDSLPPSAPAPNPDGTTPPLPAPVAPPPPMTIATLGEATVPNIYEPAPYCDGVTTLMSAFFKDGKPLTDPEYAEIAGPRSKLFFDPTKITAGIVTCGGLCPGLNNVIRALVLEMRFTYKVQKILGFRYGFEGITGAYEPILLTESFVKDIHNRAGSILGTSRGAQPSDVIVDNLVRLGVSVLFTIGGDGTQHGAYDITREVARRGLKIAVIGIPKTIDNDICYVDNTFGFTTAVARSMDAVSAVHSEARSAVGGVGIVKLMGRDAGFIALNSAVSNGDVNVILIPEKHFNLEELCAHVEWRIKARGHCVIVVAEGAGQDLMEGADEFDKSGNRLQKDIGKFLSIKIDEYLKERKIEHTVKYVDPSYMIRASIANPSDAKRKQH